MQVPGNMTTPPMRLAEGEELLDRAAGLRRKGLFGNRYGEVWVTSTRVTFVKAIMKSGLLSAALRMRGVGPMLAFDRAALTHVAKASWKSMTALVLSDGARTERFVIAEAAADRLLATLGR